MFLYPVPLRFILILTHLLRLGLPSGLFPLGFLTKTLYALFSLPCMSHAQPISSSLIWSPTWHLVRRTYCKALRCAISSIPLLLCSSLAQISSLAPYSQTTLACVPPLIWVTQLPNQVTQQSELTTQCCSIQRSWHHLTAALLWKHPTPLYCHQLRHTVTPTSHVTKLHNIAHHHVAPSSCFQSPAQHCTPPCGPLQLFPVSCTAQLCHSVSISSCSEPTAA